MTAALFSFPPVAAPDARILILGSMPGQASLDANQYYAHPRNAFWRLMAELLGFAPDCAYAEKTQALQAAQIALWDVLQSCQRAGSLDSAIERHSMVVNDFAAFFAQHPAIERVFFNGSTAEQLFLKRVLPFLTVAPSHYQRLPSTSPANAGLSYSQKLAAWRCIRDVSEQA